MFAARDAWRGRRAECTPGPGRATELRTGQDNLREGRTVTCGLGGKTEISCARFLKIDTEVGPETKEPEMVPTQRWFSLTSFRLCNGEKVILVINDSRQPTLCHGTGFVLGDCAQLQAEASALGAREP